MALKTYNSRLLYNELKEVGLDVSCDSDGNVHLPDDATKEQRDLVEQVKAAHDPDRARKVSELTYADLVALVERLAIKAGEVDEAGRVKAQAK